MLSEPRQAPGIHADPTHRGEITTQTGEQLLSGPQPSVQQHMRLSALRHTRSQ